jgi:hypothetical protein
MRKLEHAHTHTHAHTRHVVSQKRSKRPHRAHLRDLAKREHEQRNRGGKKTGNNQKKHNLLTKHGGASAQKKSAPQRQAKRKCKKALVGSGRSPHRALLCERSPTAVHSMMHSLRTCTWLPGGARAAQKPQTFSTNRAPPEFRDARAGAPRGASAQARQQLLALGCPPLKTTRGRRIDTEDGGALSLACRPRLQRPHPPLARCARVGRRLANDPLLPRLRACYACIHARGTLRHT